MPVAPVSVAPYFDKSIAAFSRMKSYGLIIESSSRGKQGSFRTRFELAATPPSRLSLRVKEPVQGGHDVTDRSYFLNNGRLTACDWMARESLSRVASTKGNLADRVQASLGQMDDAVRIWLDPGLMRRFFSTYRSEKGWGVGSVNGDVRISRQATKTRRATFVFSRATGLLKSFDFHNGSDVVQWQIKSGTVAKSLSVPSSYRPVRSFTEMPALPSFASSKAESEVRRILSAHKAFTRGKIGVQDDEGQSQLWIGGSRLAEKRSDLQWVYAEGVLSIYDPKRRLYFRGLAKRYDITDYIKTTLNKGVDPYIRQVIFGRTPFRETLTSDLRAQIIGSGTVDGQPADIMELEGKTRRVSMFVRKRDGLVGSVETALLNSKGRLAATGTRRFTYETGITGAPFSIAVPSGMQAKRLPKLKYPGAK